MSWGELSCIHIKKVDCTHCLRTIATCNKDCPGYHNAGNVIAETPKTKTEAIPIQTDSISPFPITKGKK